MKNKKLLTCFIVMFMSIHLINAQNPNCPCTPVTTNGKIFLPLFWFDYSPCRPTNGPPQTSDVEIEIDYRQVECDGYITYEILSFTTHTNYFNFQALGCTGNLIHTNTNLPSPIQGHSFHPMHPSTLNLGSPAWEAFMNYYIELLLPNGSGGHFITHEKGCHALVSVQWPANAVNYVSNGDAGGFTAYPLTSSIIRVPCDGAQCCLYEILPGPTIRTITQSDCTNASFPANYLPKYTTTDPNTGQQITYTGTISGNSGCKTSCEFDPTHPMSFTTDLETTPKFFDATIVYPTQVNEYVMIKSSKDIAYVNFYNNIGELMKTSDVTNNKIDCKDLSNGIYYVQINLKDSTIKTFKIIKTN